MGAFTVYGVLAVVCVYALLAVRATEVFFLSVRRGRTLLVRGRIPGTLRGELDEVVRRADVPRASLRAVRQGGGARLKVSGALDEGVAQRLRNVFGARSGQELTQAPPSRGPRNLGQRLGWAWLAWTLEDRRA